MAWDPDQYLRFEAERLRPALDLLARVPVEDPTTVVDLGCGPGNVLGHLRARWPDARIVGIDNDAAMLDRARAAHPDVTFVEADIATWTGGPGEPVDVIYSNAALHWLDDHPGLFPRLVAAVRPGGVLAVQMPDNWAEPSHTIAAELAAAVLADPLLTLPEYYEVLAPIVTDLDLWRTEYLHQLRGEHPVAEWFKGSLLRPVIDDEALVAEYGRRTAAAYPPQSDGVTLMGFGRVFVVATR